MSLPPHTDEGKQQGDADEENRQHRFEELLDDDQVTRIMVNNHRDIYAIRKGLLTRADIRFESEADLLSSLNRMLAPIGQRIDAEHPMLRATFPDGSRLHAVTFPVAVHGTAITIQKFSR